MTPIRYTWANGETVRFEVQAVLVSKTETVLVGYDFFHKALGSICVLDNTGDSDSCFWYEGYGASYEHFQEIIHSPDGTHFDSPSDGEDGQVEESGYTKHDVTGNLAGKLNYIESYTMLSGRMFGFGEVFLLQPDGGTAPTPFGKAPTHRRMKDKEWKKFSF